MKKLKSIILTAFLTGLLFFRGISQTTRPVSTADDGSVPAITKKSDSLLLNKIKLPEGFSISVYAEVEVHGPW